MKLKDYIQKRCVSQRALARKIGISYPTLKRISEGYDFYVSLAYIIEEVTGGEVKFADLKPTIEKEKTKRKKLTKKQP